MKNLDIKKSMSEYLSCNESSYTGAIYVGNGYFLTHMIFEDNDSCYELFFKDKHVANFREFKDVFLYIRNKI